MTNESTKTHAHKLLDALRDDKKKSSKESFIRKEPSGGFDKLSSQGITQSECMDDEGKEKKEGTEDDEEVAESFAFNGGPYGEAYLATMSMVPEGSKGRLKTMFMQMDKGEGEEEMLKKYNFYQNKSIMTKLRELKFDI